MFSHVLEEKREQLQTELQSLQKHLEEKRAAGNSKINERLKFLGTLTPEMARLEVNNPTEAPE